MKHIWCIDDYNFTLNEGYVLDDYKKKHVIGTYKIENIFDNKETAVNIFNGMILIQIKKLENYINDCKNKIDILSDKLLMDNIVAK